MGIYELLVTNEEIRSLAHDRVSTWDIKQAALKHGMLTLRMDAWDKAIAADTSVEEVLRVTKGDHIS
jgi:type II secretory ATPase GspE/PulE/Tfp pilus assembly ATPase PilB-like protein